MKPLSEIIQTYEEYKDNGFLTQDQWDVVFMKYQGCSEQHIADIMNISKKSVITCLEKTGLVLKWEKKTVQYGNRPHISPVDFQTFQEITDIRSDGLNCITTLIGKEVFKTIELVRIDEAQKFLQELNCPNISSNIAIYQDPCKTWMTKFLTDRDYTVVKAQELENVRRISVNLISIANFYAEFERIIPTDPRRIINIDETQIQSNRKFKCIIKKIDQPFDHLLKYLIT